MFLAALTWLAILAGDRLGRNADVRAGRGNAAAGAVGFRPLRYEAISFFLVVLLLSALVVRWLWNRLALDFPKLPRMTFGKALGRGRAVGAVVPGGADDDRRHPRDDDAGGLGKARAALQDSPRPTEGETMKRRTAIILGLLAALVLAAVWREEPRLLLLGWLVFLERNLRQVSVNPAGAATAVVAILLLLGLTHYLGRWWCNAVAGDAPAPSLAISLERGGDDLVAGRLRRGFLGDRTRPPRGLASLIWRTDVR